MGSPSTPKSSRRNLLPAGPALRWNAKVTMDGNSFEEGGGRGGHGLDRKPARLHRGAARHEYGQTWSVAAALLDGPKTFSKLLEYDRVMGRRFGKS